MATTTNVTITDNKAPHVLHIASGDLWAGAEAMLYSLVKTLKEHKDVKVSVILLNHGTLETKLSDNGINIHVIDETDNNSLKILQKLSIMVRQLQPDIIHTHRLKENILGSIAAWRCNIPSIRTAHGAPEHQPEFYKIPKRLILLLDRLLGRYYQNDIIAVSNDLARILEKTYPKSKIKVINNGIDVNAITSNMVQQLENTDRDHAHHFGIAGRLVPVKRVDLFIKTAAYLKKHHPEINAQFHIYGDGPLLGSLRALVKTEQAEEYIHFRGHCDNIITELQTLDALLMTSDHEGLPMILLEAMCLRIPVIAHAVGGIPELLDHGKCGTLVRNQTAKAFSDAIVNLITHPEQRRQVTLLAYERVQHSYSVTHTAKNYESIYHALIQHNI